MFYILQDPLLNIDLNSSSVWTGNWSQLCPTCKVYVIFFVVYFFFVVFKVSNFDISHTFMFYFIIFSE